MDVDIEADVPTAEQAETPAAVEEVDPSEDVTLVPETSDKEA